jgi:hypothetical protein
MPLFRRRTELAEINVTDDWISADWRTWEPPRNLVVGESFRQPALRKLTGPPRDNGYLLPVCVNFVREPDNPKDRNAFRAEVNGQHIGYLKATVAAQLVRAADKGHCSTFTVCGLLRGRSTSAPDVGVHVWLNRRLSPGVGISFADHDREVSWPPRDTEGTDAGCTADDPKTH